MNKRLFTLAFSALLLGLFADKIHAQASGVKPELIMYRHNGGGISPMPAVTGNLIGTLKWNALVAINDIRSGATIKSTATLVSPSALTANMVFSTSGAAGLKERAIITDAGLFGIGTMTPAFHLDVVGNTHTSGRFYGRIHYDFGEPTDLPNTYNDESYFERKTRAQLGLSANATYPNGGILSLAPGGGSLDRQLFTGGDDGIWTRSQDLLGGNTWAAWYKLLTSEDINGRPNLVARFLPPGPSSNKLGDGQLFDNGSNVVIGGIPAAPAVPAPAFDPADMLTVKGNFHTDGNIRATGNATIDGSTTTNSLSVTTNASVTGGTTTGTLNVGTTANVGGLATTNSLNVTTNATVNGTTRLLDKVIIGQEPLMSFVSGTHSLYVGGSAIAEEVVVKLKTAWPDYVFAQDHALQPLSEIENYIEKEKHLPGVKSAEEVAENGLSLGEMQKIQMEKIEEIYLHMIEMNKQMTALKAENEALKSKVAQLEKR